MKPTNEEIEQTANEYGHHRLNCTCGGKYFDESKFKGFKEGATWAIEKMLDGASDGFDEWRCKFLESIEKGHGEYWETVLANGPELIMVEAWQAAKLSAFRDVEFTNQKYRGMVNLSEFQVAKIKELESENKRLKERLIDAENVIEWYGNKDNWGKTNQHAINRIGLNDCTNDGTFNYRGVYMKYAEVGGKRARDYCSKYKE